MVCVESLRLKTAHRAERTSPKKAWGKLIPASHDAKGRKDREVESCSGWGWIWARA